MAELVSGRKAVAVAGTAERLSTTSVAVRAVWVMAATGNTNPVAVGGPDVVGALLARKGLALRATDPPQRFGPETGVDELGDLWVDAVTSGEAVTFLYAPG